MNEGLHCLKERLRFECFQTIFIYMGGGFVNEKKNITNSHYSSASAVRNDVVYDVAGVRGAFKGRIVTIASREGDNFTLV